MRFILPRPGRSALAADESVSRDVHGQFLELVLLLPARIQLQPELRLTFLCVRLIVAIVFPSFLSTMRVVLFLAFELIVPSFACCRFETPDAGSFVLQVTHDAFLDVPSGCLLENAFLAQAPSQLVERLVAVLQHGAIAPLLVDTILPAIQVAALRSPSLGDQACSHGCTSPCPCSLRLWSMYRLDVVSLYSNLGQIVHFFPQELLFQLSYCITHKLIVPRFQFVVHVLNEISRVHVQRIVYLARFEFKIFRRL